VAQLGLKSKTITFLEVKDEAMSAIAPTAGRRLAQVRSNHLLVFMGDRSAYISLPCLAAATNLLIESDKVVLSGEHNLKEYIDTQTLSGTPLSRYFCFTCGK
jgi:hypothetical protein